MSFGGTTIYRLVAQLDPESVVPVLEAFAAVRDEPGSGGNYPEGVKPKIKSFVYRSKPSEGYKVRFTIKWQWFSSWHSRGPMTETWVAGLTEPVIAKLIAEHEELRSYLFVLGVADHDTTGGDGCCDQVFGIYHWNIFDFNKETGKFKERKPVEY